MADSAEGCSSYDGVNAVLRGLHAARSARAGAPAALAELAPASGPVQQDAEGAEDAECLAETLRFGPQDVVLCSEHGPRALCTRCCGFAAGVEVPRAAYDAFCRAYSEVAYFERPAASEMRQLAVPVRSLAAGEVLFAPFAALVRQLGPRPGELFLDLGSGTGRAVASHRSDVCIFPSARTIEEHPRSFGEKATHETDESTGNGRPSDGQVVAWALLQPRCRARGVEIRAPLHAEATAVRDRLPREAQRRVELLHGDLFHAGGWGEADVFLVNTPASTSS
ncbi:unnamed protein product [Prorocentrum cordatum]|uniref:Histone H3-K79 methyltransferase n=1 Tax=Prorocentrum cordatum TaxID=2364126 RepID=A0ABN9U734_9DINO|nr:unnamed protein product [Polarella glacialis]